MSEIDERHLQALRAFAAHHLRFVLVGGVGLQAHGYSGATRDIDVAVAIDAANVRRADAALAELDARSPQAGTLGTSYQTRVGKVELLSDTSGVGRFEAWERSAHTMRLADGLIVLVGSPSDLLLAKETADRPKDREALPRIREELLALGVLQRADVHGPVSDARTPLTEQQRIVLQSLVGRTVTATKVTIVERDGSGAALLTDKGAPQTRTRLVPGSLALIADDGAKTPVDLAARPRATGNRERSPFVDAAATYRWLVERHGEAQASAA